MGALISLRKVLCSHLPVEQDQVVPKVGEVCLSSAFQLPAAVATLTTAELQGDESFSLPSLLMTLWFSVQEMRMPYLHLKQNFTE